MASNIASDSGPYNPSSAAVEVEHRGPYADPAKPQPTTQEVQPPVPPKPTVIRHC